MELLALAGAGAALSFWTHKKEKEAKLKDMEEENAMRQQQMEEEKQRQENEIQVLLDENNVRPSEEIYQTNQSIYPMKDVSTSASLGAHYRPNHQAGTSGIAAHMAPVHTGMYLTEDLRQRNQVAFGNPMDTNTSSVHRSIGPSSSRALSTFGGEMSYTDHGNANQGSAPPGNPLYFTDMINGGVRANDDKNFVSKRELPPFAETFLDKQVQNMFPVTYSQGGNRTPAGSRYRNHEVPVEPIRVGPGVNLDPSVPAQKGIHPTFRPTMSNHISYYKQARQGGILSAASSIVKRPRLLAHEGASTSQRRKMQPQEYFGPAYSQVSGSNTNRLRADHYDHLRRGKQMGSRSAAVSGRLGIAGPTNNVSAPSTRPRCNSTRPAERRGRDILQPSIQGPTPLGAGQGQNAPGHAIAHETFQRYRAHPQQRGIQQNSWSHSLAPQTKTKQPGYLSHEFSVSENVNRYGNTRIPQKAELSTINPWVGSSQHPVGVLAPGHTIAPHQTGRTTHRSTGANQTNVALMMGTPSRANGPAQAVRKWQEEGIDLKSLKKDHAIMGNAFRSPVGSDVVPQMTKDQEWGRGQLHRSRARTDSQIHHNRAYAGGVVSSLSNNTPQESIMTRTPNGKRVVEYKNHSAKDLTVPLLALRNNPYRHDTFVARPVTEPKAIHT